MSNLPHVQIICDGGCTPNPGPGGYAAIFRTTHNGQPVERFIQGRIEHAHNQILELTAAAEALESLKCPCVVDLFADSQYIVKGMTEWIASWRQNGWKTAKGQPVKHADLWKRIDAACQQHQVTFIWIKRYDGDLDTGRLAELVQQAREGDISQPTPPTPEKRHRLLIAGSRRASPNMIEYTRRVVARAIEMGWEIVVGDHPDGVDAAVVQACQQQAYHQVIVVGITPQPRSGGVPGARYVQIAKTYAERDQLMAKASDQGIFIWDGASSGTKQGYAYLQSLGKPAHLLNFAQTFV